jgi:hypothetical protein
LAVSEAEALWFTPAVVRDTEHFGCLAREMRQRAATTTRDEMREAMLKIAGRYEQLSARAKQADSRRQRRDEMSQALSARMVLRSAYFRSMDASLRNQRYISEQRAIIAVLERNLPFAREAKRLLRNLEDMQVLYAAHLRRLRRELAECRMAS